MSPGAGPAPDGHDRWRLRTARRLVPAGAVLGALGALGFGIAGSSGALGLVLLLLGVMVGLVAGAAHLAAFALIDELKGRPVATRRAGEAVGFFLLALLMMLLVMGAAAGAADPATVALDVGALMDMG